MSTLSATNLKNASSASNNIVLGSSGQTTVNGDLLFNSGYGSAATAYGCRAWVNFNGTGVVAIRASGNVSSITDNGTGDYTVNFTTALTDTNFSAMGICSFPTSSNCPIVLDNSPGRARTTASVSIRTMDISNFGDPVWVNLAIFR